jgi:hypothetical protein
MFTCWQVYIISTHLTFSRIAKNVFLGRHYCGWCILPFGKLHQPCLQKFLCPSTNARSMSLNLYGSWKKRVSSSKIMHTSYPLNLPNSLKLKQNNEHSFTTTVTFFMLHVLLLWDQFLFPCVCNYGCVGLGWWFILNAWGGGYNL